MSEVILTGASGLLGSHLLPLLHDAETVHAVGTRPPAGAPANVVHVAADLSAPIDTAKLPKRADTILYLAQSNRFRGFPEAAGHVFAVNTAGLLSMLDHARRAGAGTFVYASTGGVYAPADGPIEENSPLPAPGGLGFYPASKLAGELLAGSFAPWMNIVILRFFFIYGRGQKSDMLVPRLIASVRDGRPVSLQGESGLRINPIHAGDAARATAAAARLGRSATINVAGPQILSIREMCEAIGERFGRRPLFEADETMPSPSLVADISAMTSLLGPPERLFADAVAEMVD